MAIQLNEKDLEDWLWDNPEGYNAKNFIWVARQLVVASGIIDLVGCEFIGDLEEYPKVELHIVELKAVPVTSEHIAQVCRYAADAQCFAYSRKLDVMDISKVVIGLPVIHNRVQFEADAMEVELRSVHHEFQVGGKWGFTDAAQEQNESINFKAFNKVENGILKHLGVGDQNAKAAD